MVKPFAHKLQGTWLKADADAAIGNAAHRFNGEADPLYTRRVDDAQKSEAQRRAEAAQASAESAKEQARAKRQYSTPAPVLKPRSQQGRHPAPKGPQPASISTSQTPQPKPAPSPAASTTTSGEQSQSETSWLKSEFEASVKAAVANQAQNKDTRITEPFNTQAKQQPPRKTPTQSPTR